MEVNLSNSNGSDWLSIVQEAASDCEDALASILYSSNNFRE
jgi:hypothetical protein